MPSKKITARWQRGQCPELIPELQGLLTRVPLRIKENIVYYTHTKVGRRRMREHSAGSSDNNSVAESTQKDGARQCRATKRRRPNVDA